MLGHRRDPPGKCDNHDLNVLTYRKSDVQCVVCFCTLDSPTRGMIL